MFVALSSKVEASTGEIGLHGVFAGSGTLRT